MGSPTLTFEDWQVRAIENKRFRRVIFPVESRQQPVWNPVVYMGYAGWCNNHGRPLPCPLEVDGGRVLSGFGIMEVDNSWARKASQLTANEVMSTGIQFSDFWKPSELEERVFEEKWWDDFHFWENYPKEVFARQWDIDYPDYPWASDPWMWMVEFRTPDTLQLTLKV